MSDDNNPGDSEFTETDDISFADTDDISFADTEEEAPSHKKFEEKRRRAISAVPVEVIVSVGRVRPQIGELLNMRREAIIPLESKINDPVEIWVGEQMIAKGELLENEDGSGQLSVRLTDVVELDNVF